jgi:drug/metabolite transporter (DMT)-like permease
VSENKNVNNKIIFGIFYMLAASAFIGGTAVVAKILGKDYFGEPLSPFQISQSRFLYGFVFVLIFTFFNKIKIESPNPKLHLARTSLGWIGATILFGSSSLIPVNDAVALNFSNPVFAMIFSIIILKEKNFSYRWIAIIITFVGALVLIRPDFSNLYVEPVALVSIFGAICLGLEAIFIKLLTKYEKNTQILLINNFIGLILSSLIVIFFWQTPTFLQLLFCILIGFLMICAQICFLMALRSNQLNFVIPFFYSTLIFVLLYDYLIFRELPDFLSLSGSLLIMIGGVYLFLKETNKDIS